jgi:hypothetical protein
LNDNNDWIATEISRRQWIDWRDFRFSSLTSVKVNNGLANLARYIRKLIDEEEIEVESTKPDNEYLLPDSIIRKETIVETVKVHGQPANKLSPLYSPIAKEGDTSNRSQQITVHWYSTSNRERDKRRIKLVYSTLISFYGRDKFTFQIFENGKGHLIDFPNDTTRVCPELLSRLKKILGEENWRIEEITFE